MLEGLAAWVLNTYIGEYVENLNTDQLSIGFLQGEVELENLPLKKDALNELGLPLKVVSGYIGRIKLQIPVSRLKSQPWVISIEKLYLVAGPLGQQKYDEEKEKKAEQSYKQSQLKALEDKWKAKAGANADNSWWSLGSSVVTNIIENIQLRVNDVHIRYEDNVTIPGTTFACGVVIKSLSAQSTDRSWIPSFVSRHTTDMMHKLVDLQDFSIYWDEDTELIGDLPMDQLFDALQRDMTISASTGNFKEHAYVLEPVTAQARMKRNTSALPLRSPTTPRIQFDIELDKIPCSLSESQYRGIVEWLREFSRHNKSCRYRRWRPNVPVKGNAKDWWKFAITSNLHFIKEKHSHRTQAYVVQRVVDVVQYVEAYSHSLVTDPYYLDASLKAIMEEKENIWGFEELKILREVAMKRVEEQNKLSEVINLPTSQPSTPEGNPQQAGYLRGWFSGWGGWYGGAQPTQSQLAQIQTELQDMDDEEKSEHMSSEIFEDEAKLEQELRDVLSDTQENNTLLRRDTVFAQLNFSLNSGMFVLLSNQKQGKSEKTEPLLELECTSINMSLQSRPRSNALKFNISVGGLYLRDKMTKDSIMPVLVQPQKRDPGVQPRHFMGGMLAASAKSYMSPGALFGKAGLNQDKSSLFEMTYEKKPSHNQADYRLEIKTKPLDIVYNTRAMKRVSEFFTVKSSSKLHRQELELAASAKMRYEELKQQTQAELKQTLDGLLQGEDTIKAKRWHIDLDIAAPQFILPQDCCNQSSVLVVVDSGRLQFHNASNMTASSSNSNDDEDDFITPASTPPSLSDEEPDITQFTGLSEAAIHDKIYDKYILKLADVQLMVGRAKDNWKSAHLRGTSKLHVIDKFTVSVQLERRLVFTSDPQLPKTMVSGTLPSLVLHFSEQKVQALRTCIAMLNIGSTDSKARKSSAQPPINREKSPLNAKSVSSIPETMGTIRAPSSSKPAEARQLLVQFSVNQMSLEVESRNRSIAELQVSGVKAHFIKRPYDTSTCLTVHSLLIVDAMQTFGQDFELLVASHKNLCLDSCSGSIRDSDPNSPISPQSPVSPSSPMEEDVPSFATKVSSLMPQAVSSALQGLVTSVGSITDTSTPVSAGCHPIDYVRSLSSYDRDALIKVDLDTITPANPEDDPLRIANVQFNNLDVVANQQTVMELLGFFKRVFPTDKKAPSSTSADDNALRKEDGFKSPKLEVTADFHRLNFLLMTVEQSDEIQIGRKIATATLSQARIQATLDTDLQVDGSLGGLQLVDLTSRGRRHQKVCLIGQDPDNLMPQRSAISANAFTGIPDSFQSDDIEDRAFHFKLTKTMTSSPVLTPIPPDISTIYGINTPHTTDTMTITLRMASLCYIHSPAFIQDLSDCVGDFTEYASKVGKSIKNAATEMALGWVHNKKPDMSVLHESTLNLDATSRSTGLLHDDSFDTSEIQSVSQSKTVIKLDAVLQSPVLVLPKSRESREALIFHLGKIILMNSPVESHVNCPDDVDDDDDDVFMGQSSPMDRIQMEVRDMALYSTNTDNMNSNSMSTQYQRHIFCPSELIGNDRSTYGKPILADTTMELTLQKTHLSTNIDDETESTNCDTVLDVNGKIVSPLKLVLSKQVYEQILKTLDNITPDDVEKDVGTSNTIRNSTLDISLSSTTSTIIPETTIQDDPLPSEQTDNYASFKSTVEDKPLGIRMHFDMPMFSILMTGDLGDKEKGLVDLTLEEFQFDFIKQDAFTKTIDISLQSLVVEDLLQDSESKHKYLIVSRAPIRTRSTSGGVDGLYRASSCPTSMIDIPEINMSLSLPNSLSKGNAFHLQRKSVSEMPSQLELAPGAIHSSKLLEADTERLMHIKVQLVDRRSPEFVTTYDSTQRFVNVDLNCLNTTINLQTWVVLLDFLGLGAKVYDIDKFTEKGLLEKDSQTDDENSTTVEDPVNMKVDISVQSLSLVLNKQDYELAEACVTDVSAAVDLRDGNFAVNGSLGKMSLIDQSPCGHKYRERFTTTGEQALTFDVFKYGIPDPDLLRSYDISLKLNMASVRYVHTNHFLQELLAFFQNFQQLQDVYGRMRAASAGREISETAFRSSRISMNIEAGAPIMLVPHSWNSTDILVMDMGTVSVHNSFMLAKSEGTIYGKQLAKEQADLAESIEKTNKTMDPMLQPVYGSLDEDLRGESLEPAANLLSNKDLKPPPLVHRSTSWSQNIDPENHLCLLDVLKIQLLDMDLFSAEWRDVKSIQKKPIRQEESPIMFDSYMVSRKGGRLLKEKCRLELQVERNLEGDLSHSVPDFCVDGTLSSVHASIDVNQYKLVKGLLEHNFGESLEEFQRPMMAHLQDPKNVTVLSGEVWKAITISISLHNVAVELLYAHTQSGYAEVSMARLDFLQSRLLFESYSDESKDIDLVSHEIRVYDTRYRDAPANNKPNIFTSILQSSKNRNKPNSLQMELHYRSTKDFTRFTVLLNNMRLMGIFDWLLSVQEFILTKPTDPFSKDEHIRYTSSNIGGQLKSTGIITKREPATEKVDKPLEIKLNVTDTELVVVENASCWDTNAVILKSTAVLSYRPEKKRPLSCSLQSLEVFSCSLASEEDTALSIIDPMIVHIELNTPAMKSNAAYTNHPTAGPTGLLDAMVESDMLPIIEITFTTLNIRLSYNDVRLFMSILNSLPQQALQAKNQSQPRNATKHSFPLTLIRKLESLGFKALDCERALQICNGDLEHAASWLADNVTPIAVVQTVPDTKSKGSINIAAVDVKTDCICICLIDDCLDTDIPLVEFTLLDVNFHQKLECISDGLAKFKFAGSYYNRLLSGWEPLIESWRCNVEWQPSVEIDNSMKIIVQASDTLNFNITHTLISLIDETRKKWTEDYTKSTAENGTIQRRREPFIPYTIKNDTGSQIQFATVITSPDRVQQTGTDAGQFNQSRYRTVKPGDEVSFLYDEHDKIRHKHTHELKVHQILVQVDGWKCTSPVSVDKVGVYFRQANVDIDKTASLYVDQQPARVVFDITLIGTARKLITVRSALMLQNKLDCDMDVKMEKPYNTSGQDCILHLRAQSKMSVPLCLVASRLWLRPSGWSLDYCQKAIQWHHVTTPNQTTSSSRMCRTTGTEENTYRFCVSVFRDNYPAEYIANTSMMKQGSLFVQPGHFITVVAPVRIVNLLPLDLKYTIKSTYITNVLKPGKTATLHCVDLSQSWTLQLAMENYPHSKELAIPPDTMDYTGPLKMFDSKDRELDLRINIQNDIGGSLKISISAPYWLLNKTGIPLIFKQEGVDRNAAGQFEEHESARDIAPLLFSYVDIENSMHCIMRIGNQYSLGKSKWCWKFSLESGTGVRKLHISFPDGRPDLVYIIGIEVRSGQGKYRHTKIVTFAPRFLLDNRSTHKLTFAQRHFTSSVDSTDHLSALPNCKMPFHWPRLDLDQVLCVRFKDEQHCLWSGGFKIDDVSSFHINMRTKDRLNQFLAVDIVIQGPTYFVIFSNADKMPPPYRIDNYSEVAVTYYQTQVSNTNLRAIIKPRSSVDYAWDEPTLLPHITLSVQGGTSATYSMKNINDGDQLCYKNFIYIAFTASFKDNRALPRFEAIDQVHHTDERLVLEVGPGHTIRLNKMALGNRAQLWCMTAAGLLQHEGSCVPMDIRSQSTADNRFVLDIKDIALLPDRQMSLTLKKADLRRQSSQKWRFSEDGRLCCGSANLCVQVRDNLFICPGSEVLLGPGPCSENVPAYMSVFRRKMLPGSGLLAVKVLTDGPTRVLEITDIKHREIRSVAPSPSTSDDWAIYSQAKKPKLMTSASTQSDKQQNIEVVVTLSSGIGISLVNDVKYEELLYITLRFIDVNYTSTEAGQQLTASIRRIQVDNQVFGSYRPVLLYLTPPSRPEEMMDPSPVIQLRAHRIPKSKWNAEIFKHFSLSIQRLSVQVEELILWKLLQFLGVNQTEENPLDENRHDSQRALTADVSIHEKRFYFGSIKLNTKRVTLNMLTSSNMPPDLLAIKHSIGVPLVKFEDVKVDLDPFWKDHNFETMPILIKSISTHYREELTSQAAKILGSVDFLGNPLGLFFDVTEGISGLLQEGNVGGLIKNVTHGVSNSAAKFSGALSDGVGILTVDQDHERVRQQIRGESQSQGSSHIAAGFRGLGHGLVGGVKSLLSQTYYGAKEDGIEGFVVGIGKGVVGTVTKPVAGILDFASEAASAVRDTSKNSSHIWPDGTRLSRCCFGPRGLLPGYSEHHARGQMLLHKLNNNNYSETFITQEQLRDGDDRLVVVLSNEMVYFVGATDPITIVLKVTLQELSRACSIPFERKHYIELTTRPFTDKNTVSEEVKKPLVRCDTESTAQKVTQQINYAKNLYDERQQTLLSLLPPEED